MNIKLGLFSLGLALVSSFSNAGAYRPQAIEVTAEFDSEGRASGHARGDMVTARNADDENSYIGCGVQAYTTDEGTYPRAYCQASNEDDVTVICFTNDYEIIDTVKAITPYSYLSFRFENGICSSLTISTQSFYLPKNSLLD